MRNPNAVEQVELAEDTRELVKAVRKHLPAGVKTIPADKLPNMTRKNRRALAAMARSSGTRKSRVRRKR